MYNCCMIYIYIEREREIDRFVEDLENEVAIMEALKAAWKKVLDKCYN